MERTRQDLECEDLVKIYVDFMRSEIAAADAAPIRLAEIR